MKSLLISILMLTPVIAWGQTSDEVKMGRYSLVNTSSAVHPKNPLQIVIDTEVPRKIETVGEAIRFMMLRSGYQLAEPEASNIELTQLYKLPLPEVHRKLGPIKLTEALQVLIGEAFVPVIDPVHRLVSFELDVEMLSLLRGD